MTSVLERLNQALHQAMAADQRLFLLGEDLLDPYGGAFKVSRGLSSAYPSRVLTTPISEAGIVGLATGMALRGLRPVVEIMFGDFVTLIADQVVNHAAKFRWMYNDQVRVPLVIRTPMGGRRGYGPTHSQSLEKMFLGVPGLTVLAADCLHDPAGLLLAAIAADDPVLFIEHKLLYPCPMLTPGEGDLQDFEIEQSGTGTPASLLRISGGRKPVLTIACYGYNFELARRTALDLLYEHEVFTEIVLFSQLSPFSLEPLLGSLQRTGRLLTVEEGGYTLGWGAEIVALAAEAGIPGLKVRRLAALDLPIANSPALEEQILPSQQAVTQAALDLASAG
ncbi:MAG: transketolase C-terminal domain-containing protein [Chloroflexota bacterium]